MEAWKEAVVVVVGGEKSDPFSPPFVATGRSSMFPVQKEQSQLGLLVRRFANLATAHRLRAVLEHSLDERGAVLARVPLQAVRPWVGSGVDAE